MNEIGNSNKWVIEFGTQSSVTNASIERIRNELTLLVKTNDPNIWNLKDSIKNVKINHADEDIKWYSLTGSFDELFDHSETIINTPKKGMDKGMRITSRVEGPDVDYILWTMEGRTFCVKTSNKEIISLLEKNWPKTTIEDRCSVFVVSSDNYNFEHEILMLESYIDKACRAVFNA